MEYKFDVIMNIGIMNIIINIFISNKVDVIYIN
jgi:hypothetical protein